MTGVDPKGLQSFALRQIGEIEFDGPEGHETITGVILEGDAAAVRSVGALFGERVSVVAALTPLKGAPVAYAYVIDGDCEEIGWGKPPLEDPSLVLLFASQPLPETEEKALAREEILHAFFGAGKDIVKAGGGAPSRWDYRKLQDAWQAARDFLARGDAA